MKKIPFIVGDPPGIQRPLSRFLPPIPDNIATQFLHQIGIDTKQEKWILDPFGSSPRLVAETAKSGCKVLVAANNPITRFMIEMAAIPPDLNDFLAGFAALASSTRGDEKFENHIRSIYQISCLDCGHTVDVEAFLWDKNAFIPFGVIYKCSDCGFKGEKSLPVEVADKTNTFSSRGLHYARALERVAARTDPDRIFVEEALSVYTPRAIYVLFSLINKIDSLRLTVNQHRALQAILLSAFDIGNVIWGYPTQRDRPRQLTVPTRFRENNIWNVMEEVINSWTGIQSSVPVFLWPDLPTTEDRAICIYEGPLRDLIHNESNSKFKELNFSAVLTAIPRPNQAFWTLSALWSGWLWGRDAVGPFKAVLRRRRYDWNWLYSALQASFENLSEILTSEVPVLGLTAEAEAGLLTATTHAAFNCGFEITGYAFRDKIAQIHWKLGESRIAEGIKQPNEGKALQVAREFLHEYGQPSPFLKIWSAGLIGLFENNDVTKEKFPSTDDSTQIGFTDSNTILREMLTYRGGFLRYGSGEAIETSLWWLKEVDYSTDESPGLSIIDAMEISIVNYFVKHKIVRRLQIENFISQEFQGILTPDGEWLQVMFESYAERLEDEEEIWSLRKEDQPSSRRIDLENMRENLGSLAERFGYTQTGDSPIVWSDNNINQYYFYLTASALLSRIILGNEKTHLSPPHQSIIILPGGRANLVVYKLRLDPRLQRLCTLNEQTQLPGWRFMKMRHLRWLLDNAANLEIFDNQLPLDPLTFAAPQIRFI